MPVSRPRSAMRKIREILRLSHAEGLSLARSAPSPTLPRLVPQA